MTGRRSTKIPLLAAVAFGLVALLGPGAPLKAQVPGECTAPAAGRAKELGCYLLSEAPIGPLSPRQAYWHIVRYPSRAAADAARRPRETVVESLGRVWLFAIDGRQWRPRGGNEVATIGPLPLPPARSYTARYLEAVSVAGMQSMIHRHSGPEAWYMLAGTQCLETPEGTIFASAGHSAIVRAGPPMRLSTLGSAKRKALVLVLHDSAQPWVTIVSDWKPKDLCIRAPARR